MKSKHLRVLLTILVAMTSLFIFFSGKVVSEEMPNEEKISTLEPIVEDEPIVAYAKSLVIEQWGYSQWESFDTLVHKESSWNHLAENPNSSATGYLQFLDGTWDDVGCEKTFDPKEQLRCGVLYISQRYGTPDKALAFHLQNNWY